MAIDKKMEQAFNEQINKEYYSEYLYMLMKARFAEMNLCGFVNWMNIQMQEERAHAFGLFHYLHERGGKVKLEQIEAPETEFNNTMQVCEKILEHEKFVTEKAWNNPKFVEDILRDLVIKLRTLDGLQYFIVECENFESIHNHDAFAYHEEG